MNGQGEECQLAGDCDIPKMGFGLSTPGGRDAGTHNPESERSNRDATGGAQHSDKAASMNTPVPHILGGLQGPSIVALLGLLIPTAEVE